MRRFGFLFAALVGTLTVLAQAPVRNSVIPPARPANAAAIGQLLAKYPVLALSAWGAKVVNVSTGQVLYAKDSDHFFLPASNAKLFATSYAISKLGPDFRFVTRIVANAAPDNNGVVSGDLTVIGGGDPTMSGRQYPNQISFDEIPDLPGDPMAAIDTLVRQLSDAGVRRVKGDIVGNDRAYVWEPYPSGWAQDDTMGTDGAPVSALLFGDNKVVVTVRAGESEGDPASVSVVPETAYFGIASHVTTGSRTRIAQRREPGSRQLELRGQVRGADDSSFAVDDPARYFAHVLRERMLERGIAVDGVARAQHRFASEPLDADKEFGFEVARRLSPPLANIVRLVNKASQNLHAEILLREASREPAKAVSRTGALAGLRDFLGSLGIHGGEVELSDGSGLSRLDLVTPDAVVKLLRAMQKGEQANVWTSSLPVGGADGTLKDRFDVLDDHPERGRVIAKTGTLRHVTALSGYVQTPDKQLLAFSVLTNNVNASSAAARAFIDDLVLLFVK